MCGPKLDLLRQAFTKLGLATDYGGPHANGVTHMSLLGFADRSYLELIAPLNGAVTSSVHWGTRMAKSAGCCAWAIAVDDIRAELSRLNALGIDTEGPFPGSRKRPDGEVLEWEIASVGPGDPGSLLPFMIQDHTPRQWRAQASMSVGKSGLTGISAVLLQVAEMDAAVKLFRCAYGWETPLVEEHEEFVANIAYFPGTPVMLASPLHNASWLAKRLEKFGTIPAAYFLGTPDLLAATTRFGLSNNKEWFARSLAWFEMTKIPGVRLAVRQI